MSVFPWAFPVPTSSLVLLPLLLFFLFPLHFGPLHLFHVLIPSTPQNHILISHELLRPIPQTSTISEDFTHLPSFNSTTPTKTSRISEGFTDGQFAVFNTTTDTNTSHAITINKKEVQVIKKTSSLEKIEVGLARARASIQRAVVTRSYTSYKKESYIPRGPIYRNAYAFHQLRE